MIDLDKDFEMKMGHLSRRTHELEIPVMIIIEGALASGKSRLANALYMTLDAKYTDFFATHPPMEIDKRYPFLYPFWKALPKNGDINIHFRSWYAHLIDYEAQNIKDNIRVDYKYIRDDIYNFEKTLIDRGYEIIKFYVHADDEVKKEHLKALEENPASQWKAEEFQERMDNVNYEKEMEIFLENPTPSPWTILDFKDEQSSVESLFETIFDRLERRIEHREKKKKPNVDGEFIENYKPTLFNFDFDKESLDKDDYKAQLEPLQQRMREIQFKLYEKKMPLLLVYEGMDAAGKGGNIKRTRMFLDPTGYTINAVSAPTEIELAHHYLWRFYIDVPRSGHISFFDRSWYGRVLVERIEGFATNKEWKEAFQEINNFEKSLVHSGAIIIKIFLSLDKDEQLERFEDREKDPDKEWKLTDEDWRNRDKWDQYIQASEEMIFNTNTSEAPWYVIPGNNKRYARVEALKRIVEFCERRLEEQDKHKK